MQSSADTTRAAPSSTRSPERPAWSAARSRPPRGHPRQPWSPTVADPAARRPAPAAISACPPPPGPSRAVCVVRASALLSIRVSRRRALTSDVSHATYPQQQLAQLDNVNEVPLGAFRCDHVNVDCSHRSSAPVPPPLHPLGGVSPLASGPAKAKRGWSLIAHVPIPLPLFPLSARASLRGRADRSVVGPCSNAAAASLSYS